jgi:hypothetical protein
MVNGSFSSNVRGKFVLALSWVSLTLAISGCSLIPGALRDEVRPACPVESFAETVNIQEPPIRVEVASPQPPVKEVPIVPREPRFPTVLDDTSMDPISYELSSGGVTSNPGSIVVVKRSRVDSAARLAGRKLKKTALDKAAAEFVPGILGYQIPPTMRFEKPSDVVVKISKTTLSNFTASTKSGTTVEDIRVYTYMAVKLLGEPEFSIKNLSNEQQPVVLTDETNWHFEVTPKKLGINKLTVRVSARLKLEDGTEEIKDFPIYTKDVLVKSTPPDIILDWLAKYWQWLITTIVGGSGIGWLIFRKKSESEGAK